jgi:jumonji domain-containing protein 7
MTMLCDPEAVLDRIDNPTREEFEEGYLKQGRPVIVTGAAQSWDAVSTWTDEYLRVTVGRNTVPVKCCPGGVYDRTYYFEQMEFESFIDLMQAEEPPPLKQYVGGVGLKQYLRELKSDLAVPRFVDQNMPAGMTHFFFGRDTVTGYHFHPFHQAVLAQTVGTKRILLLPPSATASLYPELPLSPYFNWSRVNVERPDLARFPKYAALQPIECELHPGEMLFIPVHWWHAVHGLGKAISVTFFWSASRDQWHFPHPGRRCALMQFIKKHRKLSMLLSPLLRDRHDKTSETNRVQPAAGPDSNKSGGSR